MPKLSVALLGPVTVLLDGQPVSFGYDKLRALLAYLALEAAQPARREKLAGLLWPDQTEQSAQDSLRQALSRLRKTLGDRQSDCPLLIIERETVQLPLSSDIWVDVRAFQDSLARTSRHLHRHPQDCETCAQARITACQYYRGDFLADLSLPDSDLFEDWAAARRERLSQQAVEAFTQLIHHDGLKEDTPRLRMDILSLLKLDPWNETAHAAWMSLLAGSGQRAEAVSYYQKVRQTLLDELGIEPSLDLARVYEKIKGATGELSDQPAPRHVAGLPVPLAPLVGRRAELAELHAWLADPARRLITVTGPGGVGKTRLIIAGGAAGRGFPGWSRLRQPGRYAGTEPLAGPAGDGNPAPGRASG
jgi:DNA-binding SARP family transcriptional activator